MTPIEFSYWLKGFFEITRTSVIDVQHVDIIKKKLDEVIAESKKPHVSHSDGATITWPTIWPNNVWPKGT